MKNITHVNDPFSYLKEDHQRVAAILAALEQTTPRAEKKRTTLFLKLKSALELHTLLEEKALYPLLKKKKETKDVSFEAAEEHHVVKILLEELGRMKKNSDMWTGKFTVLKENIEHHVEEEEGDMLPDARKALTKEEILAITDAMQLIIDSQA